MPVFFLYWSHIWSQKLEVFGKIALVSEVGDRSQFYHHPYIKKAITSTCNGYIESLVYLADRSRTKTYM